MPNQCFKFKQFMVCHDKCGMKVGTDGVLLGAWVNVGKAKRILDVGTGTGLIALMLAQRCDAEIVGVEIDASAAIQAAENVSKSPWSSQISITHSNYNDFHFDELFDLIVSNPPYFELSVKSQDEKRNLARHTDSLSFHQLISKSSQLLSPNGMLSIIVPFSCLSNIKQIGIDCGLYVTTELVVYPRKDLHPKRVILTFEFVERKCNVESLIIEKARHIYADDYIDITKDYYLKM